MNIAKILDARSFDVRCNKHIHAEGQNNIVDLNFLIERFQCRFLDEIPVFGTDEASGVDYEVPPFASEFCSVPNQEHILALANEEGEVSLINTNTIGEECYIKRLSAHSNAVFDIAWAPCDTSLVSVAGDQTAKLWDVPRAQQLATFRGHSSSIKSVDFRPHDKCVFATGARDGNIMVWDTRCNTKGTNIGAENIIRNAHGLPTTTPRSKKKLKTSNQQDTQQSVTVVLFQDDNTLLSAGATDGTIKVWDLRKNYSNFKVDSLPKYKIPYVGKSKKSNGYSSLVIDASRRRLFASCTDHVIYQFDCLTSKLISEYVGHENSTFYVRTALSPGDHYLLSGSSDNHAYVWQVNRPGQPSFKLTGHVAEVTSVAWCPADFNKLVTCCDDLRLRIWRPECDPPEAGKLTDAVVRGRVETIPNVSTEKDLGHMPACEPPGTVDWRTEETLENIVKPKKRTDGSPDSITAFCSPQNSISNKNSFTTPSRTKRKLYVENQENVHQSKLPSHSSTAPKLPGHSTASPKLPEHSTASPKAVLSPSKQDNQQNHIVKIQETIFQNKESPVKRQIFDLERHTLSETRVLERHNVNAVNNSKTMCSPNVLERVNGIFSPSSKSSPTQNLPNFVLSGYPNNQCTTPVRTPSSRKVDWLTALRNKKSTPGSDCRVTPKAGSAGKVNRRLSICSDSDSGTPEKRVLISPKISPGTSQRPMKRITSYFK